MRYSINQHYTIKLNSGTYYLLVEDDVVVIPRIVNGVVHGNYKGLKFQLDVSKMDMFSKIPDRILTFSD